MKNIKTILKHLQLPYNDKIKIQRCLKLLTKGLPIHLTNNINHMYLKGETLYFVTKHQAINFELYQKLNDIKSMLRFIQNKMNKCNSVKITSIKCFTKYIKKENKINYKKELNKFYIKNSKGEFKNLAKNKKIYDCFEEIRDKLKNN